jgi:ribosomal protein L19E
MEIAYFQRLNFPGEWSKVNQHLEISRSKFFQALDKQDLVPIWGIRVYRELLPELRPKGFVDQTSYWLVTSEDSGASFRSVLISRVLQDKR